MTGAAAIRIHSAPVRDIAGLAMGMAERGQTEDEMA